MHDYSSARRCRIRGRDRPLCDIDLDYWQSDKPLVTYQTRFISSGSSSAVDARQLAPNVISCESIYPYVLIRADVLALALRYAKTSTAVHRSHRRHCSAEGGRWHWRKPATEASHPRRQGTPAPI